MMYNHSNDDYGGGAMRVVVIGGATVDIYAKSKAKINHGDSNPAVVRMAAGGVGRNIAEHLARLGAETRLITAIGGDDLGRYLLENCQALGIGTEGWTVRAEMGTGVYSAAIGHNGELYVAFCTADAVESITAADLAPHKRAIQEAHLLVVDANLTQEALRAALALRRGKPVLADAVSVAKAPRLAPLLSEIDILKLNRMEAACLTGRDTDTENGPAQACGDLLAQGAGRVFITLGVEGVCAADQNGIHTVPALPVAVQNVTGAGDAFSAGVAFAFREPLKAQAQFGAEMAARHLRRKL